MSPSVLLTLKPLRSPRPAGLLILVALGLLVLSPSLAAASPCREVAVATLGNAQRGASVHHLQCGELDRVEVCEGRHCGSSSCAPAATMPEQVLTAPVEGWVDPLLTVPNANGDTDVLVVRRYGQGAYPSVTHHRWGNGEPQCQPLAHPEELLQAGEALLRSGESFGFRGSRLLVEHGELVIIRPIYRQEDPNCCPSGGMVEIRAKPRGWHWEVTAVERPGLRDAT